jgi:hypothetical protein
MDVKKLEECIKVYCELLDVDSNGLALDFDSFGFVNVLAATAKILGLDLYDLIENFEEEDFYSKDTFARRLQIVVPMLTKEN